jgi:hypothetical protein
MSQMKITEFQEIPSDFLEEITEKSFLSEMGNEEQAAKATDQPRVNPAPEQKQTQNPFSSQGPPQIDGENMGDFGKTNVKASEIVSGELGVDILDKIFQVILVVGSRQLLGKEVPKKQFALNASEKNILAPILEKCMNQLNINFDNPFVALAVSAGFIYGSKMIEVANDETIPNAVKKVKQAAEKAHPNPQQSTGGYISTRKVGETRGRKKKGV